MKTSLIYSSEKVNNNNGNEGYGYSAYNPSCFSESRDFKNKDSIQSNFEEPYYNKMVKKPTSKQLRNRDLSKENWNSLYSDVDCGTKLESSRHSFHPSTNHETRNIHEVPISSKTCSIKNNLSMNQSSNCLPSGSTVKNSGHIKVPPWHEYENSNSNVVDITHWIMNTLGSAIRLRYLDLAGLETYISQIILLIKLITTTSGLGNKTHDSSLTSSLIAIPSTSESPSNTISEPLGKSILDGQTKMYDKNGSRLKEKRFSDIVGVIKGKKHLKNYSSNG